MTSELRDVESVSGQLVDRALTGERRRLTLLYLRNYFQPAAPASRRDGADLGIALADYLVELSAAARGGEPLGGVPSPPRVRRGLVELHAQHGSRIRYSMPLRVRYGLGVVNLAVGVLHRDHAMVWSGAATIVVLDPDISVEDAEDYLALWRGLRGRRSLAAPLGAVALSATRAIGEHAQRECRPLLIQRPSGRTRPRSWGEVLLSRVAKRYP